jgi:glutaredoxin
MTPLVKIYSRRHCHLCEVALSVANEVQKDIPFELEIIYIDNDPRLEKEFGEEIPVTIIEGLRHDFFTLNSERFKSALKNIYQNQNID